MNKKRFLALSFAAIAIVSGYAGIKAFRSQANGENDLLAQNIEALSESEGGWDFPDGRPHYTPCNVYLGEGRYCKAETCSCEGGGVGCNSKTCSEHGKKD